jgi:hypothetical protein
MPDKGKRSQNMTEASRRALEGLRDFTTIQWYVIPLLALVFYVYVTEIKKARLSGDWGAIVAGAAVFFADFLNESLNGWILALSGRSALWTAPGPTALRTMVGWNIEIMFMFSILGIIWYHSLTGREGARLFGLPEGWFFGLAYSAVCVVIECVLNAGGQLVWEYPLWGRTVLGVIPIFLFGYLWFFAWAILAVSRKTMRARIVIVTLPLALAVILDILAALLGLRY